LAGLGVTEERQKLVGFLIPDSSQRQSGGGVRPRLTGAIQRGRPGGEAGFVRKSSVHYELLTALNRRFAAEKKPAVIIKEAPEELEDEDLLEMVNVGLIPFTATADFYVSFWKQVFPNIRANDAVALMSGGKIAWAIRNDSPQLKAATDDFMARHAKGTSLGTKSWRATSRMQSMSKTLPPKPSARNSSPCFEYFKKYGDKYDVDWLLMAAQGYQESQLNQAIKSPVGAIGVMQVMPANGKELGVGDISEAEANIHAGIKYMRYMIDQYYAKSR
jgi:membrane-bound lytic murein transglycosylase MltF